MSASADLVVNIVTKVSGNGFDQAEKQGSKFQRGLGAASKVAGAALLGIGAAALHAADAAAQDAKGQALLANSMTNAAGASKAQIAATEAWIDAQSRATGVTDDELRPALGTLVRATGDVAKSQKLLATAMDISAATGKPLSSVSAALAKGYAGSTTALGKLVPGISAAALKSGKFARVLKEVKDKTDGAAKAAGDSAAGQMIRFKNSLAETEEAAGAALLPTMAALTKVLVKVGQWAQDHGTLFAIIAGGVAVFAAAIIALNLALSIYNTITAITAVVSASAWAATLGPILLVVAAVALVVVAIVLLWKKSQTFRTIVLAVWHAIKAGAQAVGRFLVGVWNEVAAAAKKMGQVVRSVWNAISSAGRAVGNALKVAWRLVWAGITLYLRAYLTVFKFVFSVLRSVTSAVVSWLRDRWQQMWAAIGDMAGRFRDVVGRVWEAVKSGADRVAAPFEAIGRAIQSVIDKVLDLIGALGRIKVPSIKLPKIPGLNSVAPAVPTGTTFGAPAVPSAASRGMRASSAGTGAGPTIIVNGAMDPEAVARQIDRILNGHSRRIGLTVA